MIERFIESLNEIWGAVGPAKFGPIGALARIAADPPPTRLGTARVFFLGVVASIGAVVAAQWLHPAAAPIAGFIGGMIGDIIIVKLIEFVRDKTPQDWIDMWRNRRGPSE